MDAPIPEGWEVLAVIDAGAVVGAVLVNGPEAHIGINGSRNIRHVLRSVIGAQLERYGYATTSVRKCNEAGHRFVSRIGYVKTHEQGGIVHYVLRELRYG